MRYIIINALLVCTLMLSAQTKETPTLEAGHYLQLKGRYGLSSLTYDLQNGSTSKGTGGGAELSYHYFFNTNWGVGTGIGFMSTSSEGAFDNHNMTIDGLSDSEGESYTGHYTFTNWKEKQHTTFIEIPILASFQYAFSDDSPWRVYADAGLKIQMPVASTYTVTSGQFETQAYYAANRNIMLHDLPGRFESVDDYHPTGDMNYNTCFAVTADAGVMYAITDRLDVFGGIGFNIGLNDIQATSSSLVTMDPSLAYSGVTGSNLSSSLSAMAVTGEIGIRLRFGRKKEEEKLEELTPTVEELASAEVIDTILVKGQVINAETESPLFAQLTFIDVVNMDTTTLYSDSTTGSYSLYVKENADLQVEVCTPIHLPFIESVSMEEDKDTIQNFSLTPATKGSKFIIKDILFTLGGIELMNSSYASLDNIVKMLEKSDIRVEISGHCDSQGSTKDNQRLSKQRAVAVVNCLVSKGISKDRLEAKGYGESQPIANNLTEEGRAKNRRVELKIIK